MATDKSLRQHYAMQGKVKNYLGKQKMVKAPEYWLSKPGHVKAKLAYITDAEEKILIDKNLYGSLRGRPNIGPAGLPSLQGGGGGSEGAGTGGGGGGGGGGGWSPGVAAAEKAQKSASADRGGKAHKATAEKAQKAARDTAREKAIEVAAKTVKTKTPTRSPHKDTPTQKKEQAEIDLGTLEKARTAPITLPKKYKTKISHTPFSEGPITTSIRDLYDPKGYERKGRALTGTMGEKTWGEQAEAGIKRSGIMGTLGKALKWGAMSLVPGLLPAKYAKTLTTINQLKSISKYAKDLGITNKDIMSSLTSNLTSNVRDNLTSNIGKRSTTDTTDTRDVRDVRDRGDGRSQALQKIAAPKDVVTAGVEKFTQPQFTQPQLTELQKRQSILQGYADKGALNKRGQSTLMQLNQMLKQATASAAHGGFIDRPLMGRSRDI